MDFIGQIILDFITFFQVIWTTIDVGGQ